MTQKLIEQKGSIWIDVWDKGTVFNEHCGGASIGLHTIFFDSKHHPRPSTFSKVVDKYVVRFACFQLPSFQWKWRWDQIFDSTFWRSIIVKFCLHDNTDFTHKCFCLDDAGSFGSFRYFDVGREHRRRQDQFDRLTEHQELALPPLLVERLPDYRRLFDDVCTAEAKKCDTRHYFCSALDQRSIERFLPSLCGQYLARVVPISWLGKVVPPKFVDNTNAIAHYVRCLYFGSPKRTTAARWALLRIVSNMMQSGRTTQQTWPNKVDKSEHVPTHYCDQNIRNTRIHFNIEIWIYHRSRSTSCISSDW